jgi:prepilin-type processing-associated H-X9-DG protein
MPQGWLRAWPAVYWWGVNGSPTDYSAGLIRPYLGGMDAGIDNCYDCPEQPWGTYIPQGQSRGPTTTYGYNGFYLAWPASGWAGWTATGSVAPWRTLDAVESPSQVFVFADALIDMSVGRGTYVLNTCYLDPPWITWGHGWSQNACPTTCFRHNGRACVVFVDGHTDAASSSRGRLTTPSWGIGYIGEGNAPHYVPDWDKWF